MKLVCVRHGETNYNILNICSDKPTKKCFLTEKGINQAKDVAKRIKNYNFDLIYISNLYRTQQTAEYINKYHNLKLIKNSKLNDNVTGFNDKPLKEYKKAFYEAKDKWNVKFNGGESFEDEKKRAKIFLDELKYKKYNSLLIITHLSVIRSFYWYFNNNLTNEEMVDLNISNCSIHEFEF